MILLVTEVKTVKYVTLPADLDAANVSTAAVVYTDGTAYPLPTLIERNENQYNAKVTDWNNSSMYTLLRNDK
ncbi:hypothetical protein L1N85_14675 [Paenibacillus alkaliterrae]|uniref:hypothetical protein n=1 Tax=Paenibacillus alkaliterrae TaxID=320909 RepID=UPI001F35A26D|nr:hypothetical protein [Paenibacillus alkaliterrae]MCF2939664.1 hypothetical protein [Paenibacillus alkaliterrae]